MSASGPSPCCAVPQAELIRQLGLVGHVEGGYYKETFRSGEQVPKDALTDAAASPRAGGERRSLATVIYYMLTDKCSHGAWHQNKSPIMHFYQGGRANTYYLLYPDGTLETKKLGLNVLEGEEPQMLVPGGVWKATKCEGCLEGDYSLVGETVSPGFEFDDMTLGADDELARQFPEHEKLIRRLGRKNVRTTLCAASGTTA